MSTSCQRRFRVRRLVMVLLGLVLAGALPATGADRQDAPRAAAEATLTLAEAADAERPGRVVLEVAPAQADDPADAVRLRAVLIGPLPGEGRREIYAFTAGLRFPTQRLEYLPATLRKGTLLEADGKTSLITGAVAPDDPERLTVGASRLGAIPGVAVSPGRHLLFSVAFRIVSPGDAPMTWEEASFIDADIKPVDGPHFVAGTLHLAAVEN